MQFSSGNGHSAIGCQCTEILVGIHGQGFFHPANTRVRTRISKAFGAFQVPQGRITDYGNPPALVGIHCYVHLVAHSFGSFHHLLYV